MTGHHSVSFSHILILAGDQLLFFVYFCPKCVCLSLCNAAAAAAAPTLRFSSRNNPKCQRVNTSGRARVSIATPSNVGDRLLIKPAHIRLSSSRSGRSRHDGCRQVSAPFSDELLRLSGSAQVTNLISNILNSLIRWISRVVCSSCFLSTVERQFRFHCVQVGQK